VPSTMPGSVESFRVVAPGSMVVGMVHIASPGAPVVSRPAMSFAKPKSRIFTRPSFVRKMFSGLRSLWMIPWACAAANP
jgi:hypothetical protein